MQSPPFPRYLVPPRSKYSPQHHVLKHPQLPFLPQCQRPSFTPIQSVGALGYFTCDQPLLQKLDARKSDTTRSNGSRGNTSTPPHLAVIPNIQSVALKTSCKDAKLWSCNSRGLKIPSAFRNKQMLICIKLRNVLAPFKERKIQRILFI